MLSWWHDPLFLFFCLVLFNLLLPSMIWLCGVGVFGLIECSHSLPALHCGLQLLIIIILIVGLIRTNLYVSFFMINSWADYY